MSDNTNKEKTFIFIDDSVDIGKEPTPITNPEIKKIHDRIINQYTNNLNYNEGDHHEK